MTEEISEYKPKGELRFVRFRNMSDDLIGYVTYKEECIIVEQPLRIDIETIFDEGRQILAMQEYLPQSIIEMKEVEFYMDEVLFITPVRQDFYEQYEYVADFFYNNQHTLKNASKKKKTKVDPKEVQDKVENVVSILEALAKKDKGPMH
jgi:hypothetical protein